VSILGADRLDLRISMVGVRSQRVIWSGAIAGVLPPGEDTRTRMLDTLGAVDRLLDQYPRVPK
jgi:hypothetical protein